MARATIFHRPLSYREDLESLLRVRTPLLGISCAFQAIKRRLTVTGAVQVRAGRSFCRYWRMMYVSSTSTGT